MRRCEACGREYADGRDFCDCGQYLRWERTREVELVGSGAGTQPPPSSPRPPLPDGPAPPPELARGEADGAGEEGLATIVLRTPGGEPGRGGRLELSALPGGQPSILHARVRNISEIVDHFNVTIHGLPESWYTVVPPTLYLLPLGHGTECEYEAEIQFHPPPRPEAEARRWDLWVVASSRSRGVIAAIASFALHIEPFELLEPVVHPRERGRRRRALYEVTLRNQGNVTSLAALGVAGVEERCRHEFARPQLELASGEETKTRLTLRPRRPLIMGRVREHRFEVVARTGEDGEKLLAGHPVTATEVARAAESQGATKPSLLRRLGRTLQIPGLMAPGLQVGQQGVQLRKPMLGTGGVQGAQLRVPARLDPQRAGRATLQPGPSTETALLPPSRGLFRQKAWLPWWLLILLLLLIALAILLWLLLPRHVRVPDLRGERDVFSAQSKLDRAKLELNPVTRSRLSRREDPGTVLSQSPRAGAKVREGSNVTVQIAVRATLVKVPTLTGKDMEEAQELLRDRELTVGRVAPRRAADADGYSVRNQAPAPNEEVRQGTAVDLFFSRDEEPEPEGSGGGDSAPAPAAGGGGGGGEPQPVVPPIGDGDVKEYREALADETLKGRKELRVSDAAPVGHVFAAQPEPGTKVKAGSKVRFLVAARFPRLALDGRRTVRVLAGATGKQLAVIDKASAGDGDPAFFPDGERLAFVSDGRMMAIARPFQDEPLVALTEPGERFSDPAFAPPVDTAILAAIRNGAADSDLCVGRVVPDAGYRHDCIAEPGFLVAGPVRWAPDGRAIYALGVTEAGFGIVRWRSVRPFSARVGDWGEGRFVTARERPDRGVRDLAISPNGKHMAVVANLGTPHFQLFLTKPGDFELAKARAQPVWACEVMWRGDSREMVVVQQGSTCQDPVGEIVRVPLNDPRHQVSLRVGGDSPDYEPLEPPDDR